MRVLVAGGAGYIGSVVTAALLEGGHEVTVLDDLSTGHADAVPDGARFVQARLQESAPVLADVRPEAVLHFAAKSLVGESQQRPELYWEHNVGGSLALLEAMRAADCRRIGFSSTAAPHGGRGGGGTPTGSTASGGRWRCWRRCGRPTAAGSSSPPPRRPTASPSKCRSARMPPRGRPTPPPRPSPPPTRC